MIKILNVLTLVILLVSLGSCAKEEPEQTENLASTGLLGQWKHESTLVNGVSDLAVACCDYLTFRADSDPSDLRGEFEADGTGYATQGVFELGMESSTIRLAYGSTQKLYAIEIFEETFIFRYTEDTREVEEHWRREE